MDVSCLLMDDRVVTEAGVIAVCALPLKDGVAVFHPLGNEDAEWKVGPDGYPVGRDSCWGIAGRWPSPDNELARRRQGIYQVIVTKTGDGQCHLSINLDAVEGNWRPDENA